MHNFVNTTFDCQGGSISVRAFALARPGVMPPLNVIGDLRRNWRRKTKDSWKTTEEMREQIKGNTKETNTGNRGNVRQNAKMGNTKETLGDAPIPLHNKTYIP